MFNQKTEKKQKTSELTSTFYIKLNIQNLGLNNQRVVRNLRVVGDGPQDPAAGDHGAGREGRGEAEDGSQVAAAVEVPRLPSQRIKTARVKVGRS